MMERFFVEVGHRIEDPARMPELDLEAEVPRVFEVGGRLGMELLAPPRLAGVRHLRVQREQSGDLVGRPATEPALRRDAERLDDGLGRGDARTGAVRPVGHVHEPEVELGVRPAGPGRDSGRK